MNTIGLIAGNGRFPFLVAEEIKRSGDRVIAIGLKEETDPSLEQSVDKIVWLHLGQFQKIIDALQEEHITTAIMAGQVKHSQLFAGLKLDWRAIKLLGRIANKKTDSILGAVADELLREGITLLPSHKHLTHLLPEPGFLCGKRLSKEEKEDISFSQGVAKAIAGLDIGQTVVVKNKAVLAVESIEGTDECIRRAAKYGGTHVIVVKVAKPNQDMRFDIPVIGPRTVNVMAENKVRALAIESGATLMIDRDSLIKEAVENGITITAL
jgi:DUF1009 family protein